VMASGFFFWDGAGPGGYARLDADFAQQVHEPA
jgi:hypothetical protein